MESVLTKLVLFAVVATLVASLPTEKRNFTTLNSIDPSSQRPDLRAGKNLNLWEKSDKRGNPEEQGTYFEGDIMTNEARNDVDLDSEKWKDGIVPYEVSRSFCKSINLAKVSLC